ncbi:helix-turn-helix domain-containing protein [Streptomyces sp. NPDC008125]|uniref:helix-turn-helix domain-containing protein n=1 Tax=Streptomyces sp. NPDC008125 TaxID=3364811 RepID=UPI0036F0545A
MEAGCTTESVPGHRRSVHLRDALSRVFPATDISVPRQECRGSLRMSRLGPVQAVTMQGVTTQDDSVRVCRLAQPTASQRDEALLVVIPVQGAVAVDQGHGVIRVSPGATVFCDLSRPMRIDFSGSFHATCLIVPKWLVSLTEDELRRLTAKPIHADTPSGSLLLPLLTQLANTAPALSSGTGEALVSNVVDLISVLAGEWLREATDETPEAARQLLSRIQEYIDQHLGDPDLSPEAIAQAHHISVRYLHKLFQYEDMTVSRWVRRRRLHACRRELARRTRTSQTIAAVARGWGFTSSAHFSRAFRTTYGMSPAEWRGLVRQKPGARVSRPATGKAGTVVGPVPREPGLHPAEVLGGGLVERPGGVRRQ